MEQATVNAAHHLDRSRLYLGFVTRNVLAGEYDRAARAVHRAATHAVTAAAVHWHQRHYSWRRLTTALGMLVRDGLLGYRHLRTFREVHGLPERLAQASGEVPAMRRLLRRFRRRVTRLRRAIIRAMHADPNPMSLEEILAQLRPPVSEPISHTPALVP